MDIGTRLDEAMSLRDRISQSALARLSGVPQPTINRILKGGGKQGPESITVKKLADALDVRFDWLMEGRGPMEHSNLGDASGRPPGWSELTRIDAFEHRILQLVRQLDERGKADAEAALEEIAKVSAEYASDRDGPPVETGPRLRKV